MLRHIGSAPYRPRVVDRELVEKLRSIGAVVLEGPKACGKTATARQLAGSEVLFDVDLRARQALSVDPGLLLPGPTPRLLDEWQLAPEIWNYVRRAVDDRGQPGQFILTGSAVPADDITRHSGAGRVARVLMRPMSLSESGHSTGVLSLKRLLKGEAAHSDDPRTSVSDLAEWIVIGGWPALQAQPVGDAAQTVRAYLNEVCRVDINRVDGVRRDPERVLRLIRSLARNAATYVSAGTLAADAGGSDPPLHDDTVREYLAALSRLFVIEDQPAWAPHLRSRSTLRSASKRHFIDPSIGVAALSADVDGLLADLKLLGFLFESLAIRDLRIYAQSVGGRVLQYRDNTGLEIDAILELPGQRWAALEIKLGTGMIDEGADALHRFLERVDTTKVGQPTLAGVIVGNGYGYVRKDGITVLPISALGP